MPQITFSDVLARDKFAAELRGYAHVMDQTIVYYHDKWGHKLGMTFEGLCVAVAE